MKTNTWFLIAAALLVLSLALRAELAPQVAVLGLTLGIFYGTLSLRRPGADPTTTHPGTG